MSQSSGTDVPSALAAWIGHESRRVDTITPRLAESFQATLAPYLMAGAGAPLGIHWCLAPDIVGPHDLGADGHPRTGLFLPVMPFPRRMWAGGELTFHGGFAIGDMATKTSRIVDLALKSGSTGRLAFLTVQHDYEVGERLVLAERQDVVYREMNGSEPKPRRSLAGPIDEPAQRWTCTPDPTLLFRYSALTFNGHRIHYDEPYATATEGYPGLVVHGPLQATLLLNLAASTTGEAPRRMSYRGRAPLICGRAASIEARQTAEGELSLRVIDAEGTIAMTAATHRA